MRQIDYGILLRFVGNHGDVFVLDCQGKAKKVQGSDPESRLLVEGAEWFCFKETWYTRAEFKLIIRQRMRESSATTTSDSGGTAISIQ